MSMSAVLSNFMVWRERHQARQVSHVLESREHPDDVHPLQSNRSSDTLDEPAPSENIGTNNRVVVETVTEDEDDIENQNGVEATREAESRPPPTVSAVTVRPRRTVSLADLEEERELARRRTSACVLLAVFILFRLWIQAIATGDFGLLLLCLVGTSWTARFIRHTREREEELDRLITEYVENRDGEVDRNDVRMLSFQAQLALAIMESQRQLQQGGFIPNMTRTTGSLPVQNSSGKQN